jgi:putative transposase
MGNVPRKKEKKESGVEPPHSRFEESMGDSRIRLIEQLCRLPEAHLAKVEEFLAGLGDCSEACAGRSAMGDKRPGARPAIVAPSAGPGPSSRAPHKSWPHAPVHRLSEHGTYIVTAATLDKQHAFRGEERLTLLEDELLELAKHYGVALEAWAVFSNHYHFVAHTSGVSNQLATLLSHLHTSTAREVNRRDATPGRDIWFNYWDTLLTFERSYLARLNYVHQNAVKHGLVQVAKDYPWCSAAWFEGTATGSQVKTIYSFKMDKVKIDDPYDPV